jgi:hypothetical protein
MRTLISLLLIPFFVLGQGLPHSHAGTAVDQPSDHAERLHVHVSGGHSHDQDHADEGHHHDDEAGGSGSNSAVEGFGFCGLPIDHDADAIYLAASTSFVGRVVATDQVIDSWDAAVIDCWLEREIQPRPGFRIAPPVRYAGVPIYLLIASLRI